MRPRLDGHFQFVLTTLIDSIPTRVKNSTQQLLLLLLLLLLHCARVTDKLSLAPSHFIISKQVSALS